MSYTKRGADHKKELVEMLEILSKQNSWLKLDKCKFSRPKVEYLGLIIFRISQMDKDGPSQGEISFQMDKTKKF